MVTQMSVLIIKIGCENTWMGDKNAQMAINCSIFKSPLFNFLNMSTCQTIVIPGVKVG